MKGRAATDLDLLCALTFAKKNSFVLVGTPTAHALVEPSAPHHLPHVVNDLASDFTPACSSSSSMRTDIHLQRLARAIEKTTIAIINPPRQGRKLLVLDLDYTLFDCKGGKRPA
eukprot:GHVT01029444.1.p3 GENE.GHVT01029444.1~~GHVT01029444.1.p3  ORF type:complete len:114 (-),score=30.33 GHVT01029444.1:1002-1343(-)